MIRENQQKAAIEASIPYHHSILGRKVTKFLKLNYSLIDPVVRLDLVVDIFDENSYRPRLYSP